MIPSIRSLEELMALTNSKDKIKNIPKSEDNHISTVESGQRKRYLKSLKTKEIQLPDLDKAKRAMLVQNKKFFSSFFDQLDYNNQVQRSYDLTLLAMQDKNDQQNVA